MKLHTHIVMDRGKLRHHPFEAGALGAACRGRKLNDRTKRIYGRQIDNPLSAMPTPFGVS
jgi:hypothetical protein